MVLISLLLLLVVFLCSLAVGSSLGIDTPRLIRSGYSGIHSCVLPGCLNYSALVTGTQAPYSKDIIVDEQRERIYWFAILVGSGQYHIGAANMNTGAPISPGGSSWSWIERPAQDIAMAFDANDGVLFSTV